MGGGAPVRLLPYLLVCVLSAAACDSGRCGTAAVRLALMSDGLSWPQSRYSSQCHWPAIDGGPNLCIQSTIRQQLTSAVSLTVWHLAVRVAAPSHLQPHHSHCAQPAATTAGLPLAPPQPAPQPPSGPAGATAGPHHPHHPHARPASAAPRAARQQPAAPCCDRGTCL